MRRVFQSNGSGLGVVATDDHVISILDFEPPGDVTEFEFAAEGLEGLLLKPSSTPAESHPGLVLIPGSSGAQSALAYARFLSRQGLAVLVLDHTAQPCGQTPSMEAFHDALMRFSNRADVQERPVLLGLSRGAEPARWIAHAYPDSVSGVITVNGYSHMLAASRDRDCPAWRAPWQSNGQDLAFIQPSQAEQSEFRERLEAAQANRHPFIEADLREAWVMTKPEALRSAASVPIPNAQTPWLAIAGGDDWLWHTAKDAIQAAQSGHTAMIYPDLGHNALSMPFAAIFVESEEETQDVRGYGGTPEALHQAYPEINQRIIAFAKGTGNSDL